MWIWEGVRRWKEEEEKGGTMLLKFNYILTKIRKINIMLNLINICNMLIKNKRYKLSFIITSDTCLLASTSYQTKTCKEGKCYLSVGNIDRHDREGPVRGARDSSSTIILSNIWKQRAMNNGAEFTFSFSFSWETQPMWCDHPHSGQIILPQVS